jgi:HNH endonuclease
MTKTLTTKTTQVCVLDQNGKPLMPTTRLGKVYRLLKTQKAHIASYEPFTIQLDYEPDTHIIQPMTLGVDSGAIHSGYSVANAHREYYSAEVIARDDISKRLSDRHMYRQHRRYRKTRYRKPRFNNRKNKKKGWLPPSLEQKVAVQLNEIDHLHRHFPIQKIIVEVAEFDIQKIKDPNISSIEYQQGTLQGYNIRNYLLEKHNRKCFYCGKTVSKFEVEHMLPKSRGGSNRIDNLTLSCHDCNQKKDTMTAEEFIKQTLPAKKATAKLKQLPNEKRLFEYMAHMNATRWALYNAINEKYPNVKMTYGYITKYNRIQANLPKAHHIDVKCITGFATVPSIDQIVIKIKMRRHNRQLHRATFSKGHARKAACLPTVTFGFQLYDLVCFNNHRYYIKGRRSSGSFKLVSIEGLKNTNRNYKKLTRLAHTNAYLINRYTNL